jgi:hypothetical protein
MNEIQARYKDRGLTIVAVNLDKESALIHDFLGKTPAGFPVALDPAGHTAETYGVKVMPSSFMIDRKGHVVFRHTGFRSGDKKLLETMLKEVLGMPG